MNKGLIVAGLYIWAAYAAPAFADSYALGAPQEEILRNLRNSFDNVVRVKNSPDHNPTFVASSSNSDAFESVSFCMARLESYQYYVAGGFRAFTRLVDKETLKRGRGHYEVTAQETQVGEWNRIKIVWPSKGTVFELAYSVIDHEQTYVRYAALAECK